MTEESQGSQGTSGTPPSGPVTGAHVAVGSLTATVTGALATLLTGAHLFGMTLDADHADAASVLIALAIGAVASLVARYMPAKRP